MAGVTMPRHMPRIGASALFAKEMDKTSNLNRYIIYNPGHIYGRKVRKSTRRTKVVYHYQYSWTDQRLTERRMRKRRKQVSINLPALRLTDLALRCLPTVQRPRYREEWRAELHELADGPRRTQWCYALKLLATAWPLRRALRQRSPARHRWYV